MHARLAKFFGASSCVRIAFLVESESDLNKETATVLAEPWPERLTRFIESSRAEVSKASA